MPFNVATNNAAYRNRLKCTNCIGRMHPVVSEQTFQLSDRHTELNNDVPISDNVKNVGNSYYAQNASIATFMLCMRH